MGDLQSSQLARATLPTANQGGRAETANAEWHQPFRNALVSRRKANPFRGKRARAWRTAVRSGPCWGKAAGHYAGRCSRPFVFALTRWQIGCGDRPRPARLSLPRRGRRASSDSWSWVGRYANRLERGWALALYLPVRRAPGQALSAGARDGSEKAVETADAFGSLWS